MCGPYYNRRVVVVVLVALTALALTAASCLARGQESSASLPDAERSLKPFIRVALTAGVLAPFAYVPLALFTYLLVTGQGGETSQGLPQGWQHVCHAVGVVVAALYLRSRGLWVRSLLAAVSVAIPLMYLTLVGLAPLTTPSRVDESARLSSNAGVWLLAGFLVGSCFVCVAALQRRFATAPPAALTVAVTLASVFGTTVVLMPQLLPGWKDAEGGGPYPNGGFNTEVWLPVMSAGTAVAVAVVLAGYVTAHRLAERGASKESGHGAGAKTG